MGGGRNARSMFAFVWFGLGLGLGMGLDGLVWFGSVGVSG